MVEITDEMKYDNDHPGWEAMLDDPGPSLAMHNWRFYRCERMRGTCRRDAVAYALATVCGENPYEKRKKGASA